MNKSNQNQKFFKLEKIDNCFDEKRTNFEFRRRMLLNFKKFEKNFNHDFHIEFF